MSSWGWRNRRHADASACGPNWLKPLAIAVPWLTVGLLFVMVLAIGRTFTSSEGALFALPDESVGDVAVSTSVALLLPTQQGTLVFFDDTRYVLEDDVQMERFGRQLEERMRKSEDKRLLAMADLRIRHGDILRFAGVVRRSGAEQVLFAEKRMTETVE